MGAAPILAPDSPWLIRPYDAANKGEEGALIYFLGIGYTRSRSGWRAGVSRAGGSRANDNDAGAANDSETRDKQRAFLEAHTFIWEWLLQNADVTLAVDPQKPGSPEEDANIWAWMVTSGPDVLHAVSCKRSLIRERLSVPIVSDLLGERLKRHQLLTLELPHMRTSRGGRENAGSEAVGIDRPSTWSMDPTWLLLRMP